MSNENDDGRIKVIIPTYPCDRKDNNYSYHWNTFQYREGMTDKEFWDEFLSTDGYID